MRQMTFFMWEPEAQSPVEQRWSMPTYVIPIISEWTFNFCEASLHKVILAMNILGSTPLCSDFRLQLCMAY